MIGTDGTGAATEGTTGNDETSGTADGTTAPGDTDASDTGSQTCACVPTIPEGWEGPVTLVESEAGVPSCPNAYPDVHVLLHAELDAPAAACACDCERPEGGCTAAELRVHTTDLCIGAAEQPVVDVAPEQCTAVPLNGEVLSYATFAPDGVTNATCPPRILDKDVPEASWALDVVVCEGASTSTCSGGELCVPSGPPVCIVAEGEHTCPDAYPNRSVRYQQVEDDRDCDCTCEISNARCAGTLDAYDSECDQPVVQIDLTDATACHMLLTATHVSWTPAVLGDCEPDATTRGDATPSGATTICCHT